MTTITIERATLDRLIDAWDSTVLPKSRDGMMQERMEDLRAALAAPATAPEQQKQLDLSVFRMSWDYELSAMRKDPSGPYVCFSDLAYMLPATAPEPFAYTTGLYGGRFTLEPVNPAVVIPKGFGLYLHPPKEKQPSWQDAPTVPGMWLCDEGQENPYCFTTHRVTWPLNSMMLGEGERWFGPIPEDKQ